MLKGAGNEGFQGTKKMGGGGMGSAAPRRP